MLGIKDINLLQSQNVALKAQNKVLQTKFFEILKICEEPADSMAELNLKNSIKKIITR